MIARVGGTGVSAARVLAWHCRAVLGRHRFLVIATVGRDGVPHLTQVSYRQEGEDLFIRLAPSAVSVRDLGAVGPIAGLIGGSDGVPLLHLSGAAEAIADPGESSRVEGLFGAEAGGESILYRIDVDEFRPRPGTLEAQQVSAGDVVVRQGDVADRFYVILSGEFDVMRVGGAGEQTLAHLGPGRSFGESGLLAGVPRNASIVATTDGELLALSRTTFASALNDTAPTAEGLTRILYAAAQR